MCLMQSTDSSPHSSCFLTKLRMNPCQVQRSCGLVFTSGSWECQNIECGDHRWVPLETVHPHSLMDLHSPGLWGCPLPTWPFSCVPEPLSSSPLLPELWALGRPAAAQSSGERRGLPSPAPTLGRPLPGRLLLTLPVLCVLRLPHTCCRRPASNLSAVRGGEGLGAEGRAVLREPRQDWSLCVCRGSRDVCFTGREEGSASLSPGGIFPRIWGSVG